ncbi:hypothetical protein JCM11251_005963 [Rhodosporidiobolus azoricus]
MLRLSRPFAHAVRSTKSVRLASSLPRVPPTDKQPFSPPPSASTSETQKEVPGQVKFPDMDKVEREVEEAVSIPSAPDSYRSSASSDTSSPTSASSEIDEKVITASHPSTYIGGGPSSNAKADDVQPGQAGDSTSSLPEHADRSKEERSQGKGEGGNRPLNEEEMTGLWKLGGIMVGGLVIGTVTDPAWRRGEKRKDE